MHKVCVKFVDEMGGKCAKVYRFYTLCQHVSRSVGKLAGFTTFFTRFLPTPFHYDLLNFQSINYWFLPITHNTNKYNNEYKLTFNYWRALI